MILCYIFRPSVNASPPLKFWLKLLRSQSWLLPFTVPLVRLPPLSPSLALKARGGTPHLSFVCCCERVLRPGLGAGFTEGQGEVVEAEERERSEEPQYQPQEG